MEQGAAETVSEEERSEDDLSTFAKVEEVSEVAGRLPSHRTS